MDEALKAKAALENPPAVIKPKEAPVVPTTQSKYVQLRSWFKLHPKVITAGVALAGVTFAAFDDAYNSNGDYVAAGKIAGGAAAVWLFAYLKKG